MNRNSIGFSVRLQRSDSQRDDGVLLMKHIRGKAFPQGDLCILSGRENQKSQAKLAALRRVGKWPLFPHFSLLGAYAMFPS